MKTIAFFLLDFFVPFGVLLRKLEKAAPFSDWPELFWRAIPQTFFAYWLCSLIPVFGTLTYTLVLIPLALWVHFREKAISNKRERIQVALWYYTVILVGFVGVWSFVGHVFLADIVASGIGWDTGSPFQTELAFATLGLSIVALSTIWVRDNVIQGVAIAKSIFWYGAAFVHIQDIVVHENFSPLNTGVILAGDIIYPTLLLTLIYLLYKTK